MDNNIISDLRFMHKAYNSTDRCLDMDAERKKQYLKFRRAFLQEELNELQLAIDNNNKEEIVDALIDISVVALGTLDFFNVDINKAWNAVLKANLDKEPGIKPGRPNPYNLPDLIKPTYWTPPNHKHNTGDL